MSDGTDILRTVIAGLITGGTSAATTFLTVFRNVKKQVADLEDRIGSSTDPKTGLYLSVATVEDSLRRLKRDIDGWEDQPPEWAKNLVNRAKVKASNDLNAVVDIESRVDTRLRSFQERLSSLEKERPTSLSREEFFQESRESQLEISEIREEMAAINGLLKGVLVALGKESDFR